MYVYLFKVFFALLLSFFSGVMYSQSGIVIDLVLPEEVGYLEQLYLKYSFAYNGDKPIKIYPPSYSWEVYLYRDGNTSGHLVYSGEYHLTSDEGAKIAYGNYMNGYTFSNIFRADLRFCDFTKSGLDVCPPNEGFTLKPGKYVLRLVYYPSEDKGQAIVKEKELIVVNYKDSKEKEAAAWLESLFHPLFLYRNQLPGCRFCDDKAIALAKEFIRRFPESRFAADAHFLIAVYTEKLHRKYDLSYSKDDYDEIIYHLEQAEAKKTGIMKEVMKRKVSDRVRKFKLLRKRHH